MQIGPTSPDTISSQHGFGSDQWGRLRYYGLLVLWSATALAGGTMLWSYDKAPGATVANLTNIETRLQQIGLESSQVLVFAHPKCPCTAATLEQLRQLTFPSEVRLTIFFFVPAEADASWHDTKNVRLAQQIPQATIEFDREGELSRRIGVKTSGHCLAVRADGSIGFSGGITISRGHRGPNQGASDLTHCFARSSVTAEYPVYGCALFASTSTN
jgi:hypothetical protein